MLRLVRCDDDLAWSDDESAGAGADTEASGGDYGASGWGGRLLMARPEPDGRRR